jgi:hypothetical protein
LLGVIVGLVLIVLGLTTVVPMAGAFGLVWTIVAIGITGFNAYNLLSARGVALYEAEVDEGHRAEASSPDDFDTRLRKLVRLRDDGIITEAEFDEKQKEIMRQRW